MECFALSFSEWNGLDHRYNGCACGLSVLFYINNYKSLCICCINIYIDVED